MERHSQQEDLVLRAVNRSTATLDEWRASLQALETCPWPGPKPLTEDDEITLLQGRDNDKRLFLSAVNRHNFVFLSGDSGVGKTSLLLCGLIPQLRSDGYHVAVCREWKGLADAHDAAVFLAALAHAQLAGEIEWLPGPEDPITFFASLASANSVLILDQFEELLREEGPFRSDLFQLLADMSLDLPIKVVISLRNEHIAELRHLERLIKPMSFSHYFLDPVRDEHAIAIITAPDLRVTEAANNNEEAITEEHIDHATAEQIATLWRSHRSSDETRSGPVGLLHLQALLYALHFPGRGKITNDTLDSFLATHQEQLSSGTAQENLFLHALEQAVRIKMGHCQSASEGLDPFLVQGTRSVVARMVRRLSSGGFKLVREARELADETMEDELTNLRRQLSRCMGNYRTGRGGDGPTPAGSDERLFDTILGTILTQPSDTSQGLDIVGALRRELASIADAADTSAGAEPGWVDRLHESDGMDSDEMAHRPLRADPYPEVTCGPMMGEPPAAVLIEELRRFTFALEWLRASDLVRLSSPTPRRVMVALIHDGFGRALERWLPGDEIQMMGALHALTAPNGADYVWRDTQIEDRIAVNLRWKGAWVETGFQNVVFVNCDFRGTFFNQCRFEGVSFVNCLLDGAMFSSCTIVGEPSPTPAADEYHEDPTDFVINGSEDEAALLERYRDGSGSPGIKLLSQLPGLPVQTTAEPEVRKRQVLEGERGSLVLYGGRVSTLAVRDARFRDSDQTDLDPDQAHLDPDQAYLDPNQADLPHGTFCLRQVGGSGFDVVEHRRPGFYEISGSALRHLTFTSPPTEPHGGDTLTVDIGGSAVFQVWIGHDITGTLRAENSLLIGIWNGSPTFSAEAHNCRYHSLVSVTPDSASKPLVSDEAHRTFEEIDGDGSVKEDALDMDYRQFPSLFNPSS